MVFEEVTFAPGSTELNAAAMATLDEWAEALRQAPQLRIQIEGHTDSIGSVEVNERVGLERAEAVVRYLSEDGKVPLQRMNVVSWGEERPAFDNMTDAGRTGNRRVTVGVVE